jgi:imidazole glycerol-phosphate synthase subunit HisF
MMAKRIIVCLDVRDKQVTKGVKFKGNVDIGEPVSMGAGYSQDGADELVFYDITASAEKRPIDIDMVTGVAANVFIPFAVGGGIRHVDDMVRVLMAGAEKVSVNSLAVCDPAIITDGARQYGSQCIVLGMDVRHVGQGDHFPSGYEVVIEGGRRPMGKDALEWAREATDRGAGEIVLNSIDTDGTRDGYDIDITGRMAAAVSIPVVASGGAGRPEHITRLFQETEASAALIASMVHYGDYTVEQIKRDVAAAGVPMRLDW